MYSFATPPIKLKPGEQIGGGLLIANHLDQSLCCTNQKHWVAVKLLLLHFFCRCKLLLRLLPATGNLQHYTVTKPFSWAKPTCVRCSSSNFTVQSHILSTAGDAHTSFEVSENLVHHCWWMGNEWIFFYCNKSWAHSMVLFH